MKKWAPALVILKHCNCQLSKLWFSSLDTAKRGCTTRGDENVIVWPAPGFEPIEIKELEDCDL